jgi:hypothetical protein
LNYSDFLTTPSLSKLHLLSLTQGALIDTLADARLYAVGAGLAYFFWRRGAGQAVLGTILAGMAVYLPLHIGLGW